MASILSSRYQPSPRFAHYAVQVGRRCYMWGGRTQDFLHGGKDKLKSTVNVFDPYLETCRNNIQQECHPVDCIGEQQRHTQLPCIHLLDMTANLGTTPFTYWTPTHSCGQNYLTKPKVTCQRVGVAWFSSAHTIWPP